MMRIEVNAQTGSVMEIEVSAEELAALAPSPPVTPRSITRRQAAQESFSRGLVTGDECVAWTATGEPPPSVATAFAALAEPDRTFARSDFAAVTYERSSPRIGAVIAIMQPVATEADVDDFFRAAAFR